MRLLLLAALLIPTVAETDTLATLDASQVAAQRLNACFDRNFKPGADKPVDSKAAQNRLLASCQSDWEAATQACHVATGNPIESCRTKTGKMADDFLGLKGNGIQ